MPIPTRSEVKEKIYHFLKQQNDLNLDHSRTNSNLQFVSVENFANEYLGIDEECALKTNLWVTYNYNGRTAEAFPRKELVSYYLEEGYYMLFKYNAREPEYMFNETFMNQFPIYYEDEDYIILGEGCAEINDVDVSYIDRLNNDLLIAYNYTETNDPCVLLMDGNQVCYFIDDVFEKII